LQDAVFRELYSEKRVVLEERRARVDNAPLGKFLEGFQRRAYSNNYGRPVIGFQHDIEAFGRQEVQEFFQKHYGPRNLTIAIVGDVEPNQVTFPCIS
jgi:predicted Zn-dependent peptidase